MARVKISEYRAKTIINNALANKYVGLSIDTDDDYINDIDLFAKAIKGRYVVKVDQAVKKRNKLGLVLLNVSYEDVARRVGELKLAGYKWVLVEPFVPHEELDERFIALQRDVDGIHVGYSSSGGVNIEDNPEHIKTHVIKESHDKKNIYELFEDGEFVEKLIACFEDNHFTYLEINPYIRLKKQFILLDAAVELDTAAEFFVGNRWTLKDVRSPKKDINIQEQIIEELASKSPSSLSLKVLNKDGSIFLLLSGGGASVVVADEFSNLGYHEQIANYGEYSGNPNEEETYLYTKQVLSLLLASDAKKKILLIAGGVANFTDISKTFNGIIRALEDDIYDLLDQNVTVLVRRGGPNQSAGLKTIQHYLNNVGLRNIVHGPEKSLASIVALAVGEL